MAGKVQTPCKEIGGTEMTEQEKRTKLAEAVGWKPRPPSETQYEVYTWSSPYWKNGKRIVENSDCGESFCFEWQLPDPFTDANACNALIKHLNGLGYGIDIYLRPWMTDHVAAVTVNGPCDHHDKSWDDLRWQGDNWMHGVCELALKVIE